MKKTGGANAKWSYYNFTVQMNCTVTSFQKTGGAKHPLGPMDATPMDVS